MSKNLFNCAPSALLGKTVDSIKGLEGALKGCSDEIIVSTSDGRDFHIGGGSTILTSIAEDITVQGFFVEDLNGSVILKVSLTEEKEHPSRNFSGNGMIEGGMFDSGDIWTISFSWKRTGLG